MFLRAKGQSLLQLCCRKKVYMHRTTSSVHDCLARGRQDSFPLDDVGQSMAIRSFPCHLLDRNGCETSLHCTIVVRDSQSQRNVIMANRICMAQSPYLQPPSVCQTTEPRRRSKQRMHWALQSPQAWECTTLCHRHFSVGISVTVRCHLTRQVYGTHCSNLGVLSCLVQM